MLEVVQSFHDKHDMENTGGHDLRFRVALMCEELGEVSAAITKGKGKDKLAEECADLLILLLGTSIASGFDLNDAFWQKMARILERKGKFVYGTLRISDFDS
jgi:NTP pyrophosphatase (non-canonical NTP hydrolase)